MAATISGRVTVPSSRSVPRALPVRSDRSGDVEHIIEELEGEADLSPEVAEGGEIAAEQAGAFEQGRGLQAAAIKVALLGDTGIESVLALGQLAVGQ